VQDLERRLRESHARDTPFVWVERIDVSTRRLVDIDQRKKAQDFLGDLLRLFDEYRKAPDRVDGLVEQHLESLYSSPRGRRFLELSSKERLMQWLDEAEAKCIDLLIEDEG